MGEEGWVKGVEEETRLVRESDLESAEIHMARPSRRIGTNLYILGHLYKCVGWMRKGNAKRNGQPEEVFEE
jgi:hypothetical protein